MSDIKQEIKDEWLKKALQLREKQDWANLIIHSLHWTAAQPQENVAWMVLGDAYRESSEYVKAIEACNEAVYINPQNHIAHNIIGLSYYIIKQYTKAIEAFKKASSINPKDDIVWQRLGDANRELCLYTEAIEAYNEALHVNPKSDLAFYKLGDIYYKSGRYNEAVRAFNESLCINPKNEVAWDYLGSTHRELGRYTEAIEAYNEALSINPQYYHAYNNIGYVYYLREQYPKAIEAYKQVFFINPNYKLTWRNLGNAYKWSNQYDAAIEAYNEALRIDPEDINVWKSLGYIFENSGQYAEAINAYKMLLSFRSEDQEVLNSLGNAYRDSGQYEEAITTFKKILTFKPEDRFIWSYLSDAYYKSGQYIEAISAIKKSMSYYPEDELKDFMTGIFFGIQLELLGNSYMALNQHLEAIKVYKDALNCKLQNNSRFNIYTNMGKAYSALDKFADANQAFKEAIKFKPKDDNISTDFDDLKNNSIKNERLTFKPIETDIAGGTYENRQSIVNRLFKGAKLTLNREPDNIYDPNAIVILYQDQKCGYIRKEIAKWLSRDVDEGMYFEVTVTGITIDNNSNKKVNIHIERKSIHEKKIDNEPQKDIAEIPGKDMKSWLEEGEPEETSAETDSKLILLQLTNEQKEIISHELGPNETLNIIAFAGTGKTTTLLEYTKAHPELRFLYIAFNKSVQEYAVNRFPQNVEVRTSHSLAWTKFGAQYKDKLVTSLKLTAIKKILDLDSYRKAQIIADILHNFITTDKLKFSTKISDEENISAEDKNNRKYYIEMAAALWVRMVDPNYKEIGITHDGYLKLFQLSKPKLDYDIILLDEAQDTNPATADIVLSQACPKILVGDPHQQIYAFRGAQDAMQNIVADRQLYLTYSFRFGEEIAWLANKILKTFKNEKESLKGCGPQEKDEDNNDYAIIARTNAMVFDQAVAYSNGKKIAFVGGIDGYRFDRIADIYQLYADMKSNVKDPFIRDFQSYSQLTSYISETNDIELRSICKVVEKYGNEIPPLIDKIKKAAVDNKSKPDIFLTTAHKAKGSQFSRIRICDDFPKFFPNGSSSPSKDISNDEANLLYVTVTRAKHMIEFDTASDWERFISFDRKSGYAKVLEYFNFREPNITINESNYAIEFEEDTKVDDPLEHDETIHCIIETERETNSTADWIRCASSWRDIDDENKARLCMVEAERKAETLNDWVGCAEGWKKIIDDESEARRCMKETLNEVEGLNDWLDCAYFWKKILDDDGETIWCIRAAERIAESFNDWEACANMWGDLLDLDSEAKRCIQNGWNNQHRTKPPWEME